MGYPPFACYDATVGYDRKRTEHAPSGDQLGWIEYCRDQDEGAKAAPAGDMTHLRPRLTDEERFPIEGYLHTPRDAVSAAPGEAVTVHATSRVGALRLRVYREGATDGECLHEEEFDAAWQPVRSHAWWRGAGWPTGTTLTVPADWRSGVYRLELTPASVPADAVPKLHQLVTGGDGADQHFVYSMLLCLRATTPATSSPIVFKLSTNSYYAYNNWGGHSLYGFHSCASWGGTAASASAPGPDGSPGKDAEEIDYTTRMITEGGLQSHRVSPYRPGHGYYGSIEGRFLTWERLFLLWADRNGVPLEFCTDFDVETWPAGFDDYKCIVSVGHDEYYSATERTQLQRYSDGGGNIAFFSGNLAVWQVRHETDPTSDRGAGSREEEGYPWTAESELEALRSESTDSGVVEGGSFMICYKQYHKRQPAHILADPTRCTGFAQHPTVTGGRPINVLTGLGPSAGGYHRSHGQLVNDSGGFTVLSPRTWLTDGLDLMTGAIIGSLDSVVGYECDGCARQVDADGTVRPSGEDGTPAEFVIVAQAHSSTGGPGGQWGAEFSSSIPSMELFEHEAAEMAVESNVIKDYVTEHAGWPTLGYMERPGGGGTVVNTGCTDWACGLRRDLPIQQITMNTLRRLSGIDSLQLSSSSGSAL